MIIFTFTLRIQSYSS